MKNIKKGFEPKEKEKTKAKVIRRDAITGQFASKEDVKANPNTTVTERIPCRSKTRESSQKRDVKKKATGRKGK